jgi:hypothetical protein
MITPADPLYQWNANARYGTFDAASRLGDIGVEPKQILQPYKRWVSNCT